MQNHQDTLRTSGIVPPPFAHLASLSGLLGAAGRTEQINQPRADETLASQGIVETEALPERRINIAVRETVHQPLRLYSVKAGQQVRDLVEEAVVAYLQAKGELE